MSERRYRLFSVGDNLFILLLVFVGLAYCIVSEYLELQASTRCFEADACEFVSDEDGDLVIRVKPRSEEGP